MSCWQWYTYRSLVHWCNYQAVMKSLPCHCVCESQIELIVICAYNFTCIGMYIHMYASMYICKYLKIKKQLYILPEQVVLSLSNSYPILHAHSKPPLSSIQI